MAVEAADVTEAIEARLVALTGHLVGSARRAASGTVSFDLADASGVVRVVLAAALQADDALLESGVEVEVVGIVGQETTAAQPLAGYRIWPRTAGEVRIIASPQGEPDAQARPAGTLAAEETERGASTSPTVDAQPLAAIGGDGRT